jgi:branched-chain amino acid transport system permease protein
LVAGIGLATILNQVVVNQTAAASFGVLPTAFTVTVYRIGSIVITNIDIIIVAVALVASCALDQWVRRSRYGRAVRAVAYDPTTSGLLGINVNVLAPATMFFAGLLAGIAGVLLAINLGGGEDITAGQTYLLTAFAIVIVGGVGNVRGVLTASYFIAVVETLIVAYGPAEWRDGVAFLLIVVVLVVRPQGLFARGRVQRA